MPETSPLIVLCTCPDRTTADVLAAAAVDGRVAACVNIVEGVTSLYLWRGAREQASEVLLIAKTTSGAYAALERLWRARHPYELPEIVAVPIATGSAPYLAWIDAAVAP
jgi:periplasmic divalent cation tolerance protein